MDMRNIMIRNRTFGQDAASTLCISTKSQCVYVRNHITEVPFSALFDLFNGLLWFRFLFRQYGPTDPFHLFQKIKMVPVRN